MKTALRMGTRLLPIIPLLIGLVSLQVSATQASASQNELQLLTSVDFSSVFKHSSTPQFDDDLHDSNEAALLNRHTFTALPTLFLPRFSTQLKSYPIRGPPSVALS